MSHIDETELHAEQEARKDSSGLSTHMLPTSATMTGVCMTVLSIGHLGSHGELWVVLDKLLAIDALVFLASALLSFMSMRSKRFGFRYEVKAEWTFIIGLGLLALGAVFLAFKVV
jgi:drug/metabolite transporter (DMT)-like permease